MRALPALLLSCLLVAGCQQQAAQPSIKQQEAARQAEVDKLKGEERLFVPSVAIGAANQFGYHNQPLAQAKQGAGYVSTGLSPMISSSFAKAPNQTSFTATAAKPDTLDTLEFTLSITDPENAATAKKRFRDILDQFLALATLAMRDDVKTFVTDEAPASKSYPGIEMRAERSEIAGTPRARKLTVTFTRSEAAASGTSKPQGT